MKDLTAEERPVMGQLINEAKVFINTNLDEALNKLKKKKKWKID